MMTKPYLQNYNAVPSINDVVDRVISLIRFGNNHSYYIFYLTLLKINFVEWVLLLYSPYYKRKYQNILSTALNETLSEIDFIFYPLTYIECKEGAFVCFPLYDWVCHLDADTYGKECASSALCLRFSNSRFKRV